MRGTYRNKVYRIIRGRKIVYPFVFQRIPRYLVNKRVPSILACSDIQNSYCMFRGRNRVIERNLSIILQKTLFRDLSIKMCLYLERHNMQAPILQRHSPGNLQYPLRGSQPIATHICLQLVKRLWWQLSFFYSPFLQIGTLHKSPVHPVKHWSWPSAVLLTLLFGLACLSFNK